MVEDPRAGQLDNLCALHQTKGEAFPMRPEIDRLLFCGREDDLFCNIHADNIRNATSNVNLFLTHYTSSVLHKAENIKGGSASYNLACVNALMGNEEDCKKWLQKSKEKGTLPSLKHVNEDKDLDSVRDKQWFKDLIKDVK
jgi:hypothetical protein